MNETMERLLLASRNVERLSGVVLSVQRLDSGTTLGICYEGVHIMLPADKDERLGHPEQLIGAEVYFIIKAVAPGANVAAGLFAGRKEVSA